VHANLDRHGAGQDAAMAVLNIRAQDGARVPFARDGVIFAADPHFHPRPGMIAGTVPLKAVARHHPGIRHRRGARRKTLQQQAQQGRAHSAQATVLADLQEVDERTRWSGRMAELCKGMQQQPPAVPGGGARELLNRGVPARGGRGRGRLPANELGQQRELGARERREDPADPICIAGRAGAPVAGRCHEEGRAHKEREPPLHIAPVRVFQRRMYQ